MEYILTTTVGVALALFIFTGSWLVYSGLVDVRNTYFPDRNTPLKQQIMLLLAARQSMAFVAGGLLSIAMVPLGLASGLDPAGAVAIVALCFILPFVFFKHLRTKRSKLLDEQFQPSLLLLASAIRAGKSITLALSEVATIVSKPLSDEYLIIKRQLIAGVPLHQCLEELAARTQLPDVKIATTAMMISIRTGSDLAIAFDRIAETIRSRKALKSKVDAMTTQGRAQGLVAGLAPLAFGVMFYVIDPGYMSPLLNTTPGNLIILGVMVLQCCAYFSIRKITDVRV